jgi:hypothetical protein
LPVILWREDDLRSTDVTYYHNSKLQSLKITNSDLTYLEFGEMQESYSDHTQKSSYSWELWSTTDQMTDRKISELIAGEVYLQNKATPETIESFKMYASDQAICTLLKLQNRLKGKRKNASVSLLKANRYWRVPTDAKAIKAMFNLRYS